MYNIFGTGRDIKKYLHRTVDPGRFFIYSDFPISILYTLYKKCTFVVGSSRAREYGMQQAYNLKFSPSINNITIMLFIILRVDYV